VEGFRIVVTNVRPTQTRKFKRDGEGPRGGKSAALTIRIRRETREALDAAALRTGRLIGQVAELWLEQARALNIVGAGRAGVADAHLATDRLAARVTEEIGDPGELSSARTAFRAGSQLIWGRSLPFTPPGDDEIDLSAKLDEVAKACAALDERVKDQIAGAYGDASGGGRVDETYKAVPDVQPAVSSKPDPVASAYFDRCLTNAIGATAGGQLLDAISVSQLVDCIRFTPDRFNVAAIDAFSDGLSWMKLVGQSFGAEIEIVLQKLPLCRQARVAYEKSTAEAQAHGERLAASIVSPSSG
jgi:hypothetical protein